MSDLNSPQAPFGNDVRDMTQDDQAEYTANQAAGDDFDIYQMAEGVFASLTLDDWAVIPDDNDPFDGRDPFADGVKWVPGLGPPPEAP